jgi:hypothetical protein
MRSLSHRILQSASRVTDDVERFVVRWRLEIQSDGVELRIRRPRSAGRQVLRSILQLTLAQFVRRVDEVQLVLDMRALEHLPEPGPPHKNISFAFMIQRSRFAPGATFEFWLVLVPLPSQVELEALQGVRSLIDRRVSVEPDPSPTPPRR